MTRMQRIEAGVDLERLGRFGIDRKRPAAPQIYEDLRERIVSLEISPGTNLSRSTLAEHYRVSQTPVRDAILKLEQDGLVEIYPQSRTLVARIDTEDARETQFLRMSIELEATRLLARGDDKTAIGPARELLDRQKAAGSDLVTFTRLDRQFHQSLCEAAGHRRLWELIIQRSGHLDRLRRLHLPTPGKIAQILLDHAAIIDAILASDVEATATAVRAHLSGTLSAAGTIAAQHPDHF